MTPLGHAVVAGMLSGPHQGQCSHRRRKTGIQDYDRRLLLFLILLLAFPLKARFRILRGWTEPARTAASIAIIQYAGTWLAFLAYFVLGMGPTAFGVAAVISNHSQYSLLGEWACHYDDNVSLGNPLPGWFLKIKENWVFILFVFLFPFLLSWDYRSGMRVRFFFGLILLIPHFISPCLRPF